MINLNGVLNCGSSKHGNVLRANVGLNIVETTLKFWKRAIYTCNSIAFQFKNYDNGCTYGKKRLRVTNEIQDLPFTIVYRGI